MKEQPEMQCYQADWPVTVVVVGIAVACSWISGHVHVRLQCGVCGYAVPYNVESAQNNTFAFRCRHELMSFQSRCCCIWSSPKVLEQ